MTALALPRRGLIVPRFEPWRILRPLKMALDGQFVPYQGIQGEDLRRIFPTSWTPASLGSALQAWFKADVGLTLSGAEVTGWADQSGNGVDLSVYDTTGPTYAATGLNSLPTLVFDNTADFGLTSASAALALGAATCSVFAVATIGSNAVANARLAAFIKNGESNDYGNDGSASLLLQSYDTENFNSFAFDGGSYAYLYPEVALAFDTAARIGAVFSGSEVTPYLNGSAQTAGGSFTVSFGSTGVLRVGATGDNSDTGNYYAWDGKISELIVTNTALSSGDLANLDAYLVAKWGF